MHTPCNCVTQCSTFCDRWVPPSSAESKVRALRNPRKWDDADPADAYEKFLAHAAWVDEQDILRRMNELAQDLYAPKLGVHTPWWKNKRWWERTLYGKCKWCFPVVVVILIYTGYMLGGSQ